MNLFSIILLTSLAIHGCAGADGTVSNHVPSADTAMVAHIANGVSELNSGMKKGDIELKGQLTNPKMGKLFLWETHGKTTNKIDSTNLNTGAFSFAKKEYEQGVYMVGVNENNMCPIILNPSEAMCEIGFKGALLEQTLYAINSKENEGWAKYIAQEPTLLKAIKDARVAAHKATTMKVQMEEQTKLKEAELLTLQSNLIKEYPNTHLSKLLTWKQEPSKTEIDKYWNNIDFSDESLVRCKVLTDRIESFMRTFSKGTESGFINCIATVAEKAKANDRVLEFALNQMLVGFYESGMDNICTFIIDNYVNGEACGDADLSNVIKSTAEGISNLGVGKTPPNFTLNSNTNTVVDLYKTATTNSYTLVMFWSSWCEHCIGEAPEVVKCYSQWKTKGFETVGVSIDSNKASWEAAIKARGFTFPNVCGMKEYQSPVAKEYRVTKTPTFFLLDKDKKIVLKPKGIREVQTFLATHLK